MKNIKRSFILLLILVIISPVVVYAEKACYKAPGLNPKNDEIYLKNNQTLFCKYYLDESTYDVYNPNTKGDYPSSSNEGNYLPNVREVELYISKDGYAIGFGDEDGNPIRETCTSDECGYFSNFEGLYSSNTTLFSLYFDTEFNPRWKAKNGKFGTYMYANYSSSNDKFYYDSNSYGCPEYYYYYEYDRKDADGVLPISAKYHCNKDDAVNNFCYSNDTRYFIHRFSATAPTMSSNMSGYNQAVYKIYYDDSLVYDPDGHIYFPYKTTKYFHDADYIHDMQMEIDDDRYDWYKEKIYDYCAKNGVSDIFGKTEEPEPQQEPLIQTKTLLSCTYWYGAIVDNTGYNEGKCTPHSITITYYDKETKYNFGGGTHHDLSVTCGITGSKYTCDTGYIDGILSKCDDKFGDSDGKCDKAKAQKLLKYDASTGTYSCPDSLQMISGKNRKASSAEAGINYVIPEGDSIAGYLDTDIDQVATTNISTKYDVDILCPHQEIAEGTETIYQCQYYDSNAKTSFDIYARSTPSTKKKELVYYFEQFSTFYSKNNIPASDTDAEKLEALANGRRINMEFVNGTLTKKLVPTNNCEDIYYYGGKWVVAVPENENYIKEFCKDVNSKNAINKVTYYCKGECKYTGKKCNEYKDFGIYDLSEVEDPDIYEKDENGCYKILKFPIMFIKRIVFNVLQIFIPILLILMASIDLTKYVLNPDDDKKHQTLKKCVNRFIIAIAFFFVTTIVTLILNTVAKTTNINNTSSWRNCWVSIK